MVVVVDSERPKRMWPKQPVSTTTICQDCDLPICLDETGWSDIWFAEGRIIYGPGGYFCHAWAFRKPHTPSEASLRTHLSEMQSELAEETQAA
jgi:hypothetical protein